MKLAVLFCLFSAVCAAAGVIPVDLRCDYADNPLGVDSAPPRLFWKLTGDTQGQRQTAYQILAASSEKILTSNTGDLWDSGRVVSDETIQIQYKGKIPASGDPVFWKIRVWDEQDHVSDWSASANWTMGVLQKSDWPAGWIGAQDTTIPSLLLRREFVVKQGLRRAIVNICGLGQYELSVNGRKIGDDVLSPGWTKYERTCLYDTRDITAELHPGNNAVGVELADGMYKVISPRFKTTAFVPYSFGPQQLIARIRLEYADGKVEYVGTDGQWRVASGPITYTSIYGGEDFDARLIQAGWDQAAFNDSAWKPAIPVSGPGGELKGQSCAAPPILPFERFQPVEKKDFSKSLTVYDLGQNASLMLRLRVSGPAGSMVKIVPSELINREGGIDDTTCHSNAFWTYTLSGKGEESWVPKFFYRGARYLQVETFPAKGDGRLPEVKSVEGLVVQSDSKPAGGFECSNQLFNKIRQLVRWAQRSNMMSIMTDCPQREKRGWLEEDHLNGPSLRYEFDLAQLFTKCVNDMADSQLSNGLVPDTAPDYRNPPGGRVKGKHGVGVGSPEWGSSFILVPWQQYQFDGDLELFRRYYSKMKRYVAYLRTEATNNIISHAFGDWKDVGPKHQNAPQLTPPALTATAFYYQDVKVLAEVAALLGKTEDAEFYRKLAEEIRVDFNKTFYDAGKHSYSTGSQTANAVPLVMQLCDPADRPAILEAIVTDVRLHGLTAGDVGYRYLLRALAEGGRSDVIFEITNQSDKPGYGYQLKKGATSLIEAWDAGRGESQNHFMLGQIQEWFYHDLAGIQNAPDSAGFKKIIIDPQPVGDIQWVKASYESIRGKIVSNWKRNGKKFTLNITIPVNTTATVFVPAKSPESVTVSNAKYLRFEKGCAVWAVDSGTYEFVSDMR